MLKRNDVKACYNCTILNIPNSNCIVAWVWKQKSFIYIIIQFTLKKIGRGFEPTTYKNDLYLKNPISWLYYLMVERVNLCHKDSHKNRKLDLNLTKKKCMKIFAEVLLKHKNWKNCNAKNVTFEKREIFWRWRTNLDNEIYFCIV